MLNYADKRVAILAPASASNEMGGAERFYQGLLSAIQEQVDYAELISMPMDESTFEGIQNGYKDWSNLDLSAFDMVISTKAPTYVVNHPRHVLYLVHTIRVFYDMFEEVFPDASDALVKQRETIHSMDTIALAKIKKCYAIGYEVANRISKWNNQNSDVLHPPLGIDSFRPDKSEGYFFMPGRLHSWKRVDLAIRAVKASGYPLKLVIAGTGEAEDELKQLAADHRGIAFLGRVSDDELVDLYAKSLAVIFVPIREDYGYVTLEAFKSAKPVITCTDSGEPLCFVRDGKTGYVSAPDAQNLCVAMENLFKHPEQAAQMGESGRKSIEHINWPNVATTLLDAGFTDIEFDKIKKSKSKKVKVAVLDMQPIDPAVGGGRLRLLGLYHGLGGDIDAKYVGTYDWPGEKYRQHYLTPTLEEINVPLSDAHHHAAKELGIEAGGKTVIDLAFSRLCHLSPEYLAKAEEIVNWADIVVFSHPWVFPLMEKYLKPSQIVVYDSHNVEGYLRAQLLDRNSNVETELLREVVLAEYLAGERAHLILACSQADIDLFSNVYEWPESKMTVVPNGVMISSVTLVAEEEKHIAKQKVGLSKDRIAAIFIGSAYQPNVEAATFIVNELAVRLPKIDFVIAGGVGASIGDEVPSNVVKSGFMDDEQKLLWLHAADIAINPMFSGSGTNIKMFDFMAAGLPIITTLIGARGITQSSLDGMRVVSRDGFCSELKDVSRSDSLSVLGRPNRKWVEKDFAWENISASLGQMLLKYRHEENYPCVNSASGFSHNRPTRIAHISTIGHKCGIGEYTSRLITHLSDKSIDNLIVTCKTTSKVVDKLSAQFAHKVVEGWYYDDQSWCNSEIYPSLVSDLVECKVDSVLIQYHNAFFNMETLIKLATSLRFEKMNVAVTIHRLEPSDMEMYAELRSHGVRLLSHSSKEIETATVQGVSIEFLPIGVDMPVIQREKTIAKRDWLVNPPRISTTGFLRSHKGITNLIHAVGLMQREFPGTRLLVQSALYQSLDSQETFNACLDAIEQCRLESYVEMDTDFLPIETIADRISKTDIAVLAYTESDEGGSASATTCFSAGLPLVVSGAEIFYELNGIAYNLNDVRPEAIANSLCEILKSPTLYAQLVGNTFNYTKEASWENVSAKLIDILNSNESEKPQ